MCFSFGRGRQIIDFVLLGPRSKGAKDFPEPREPEFLCRKSPGQTSSRAELGMPPYGSPSRASAHASATQGDLQSQWMSLCDELHYSSPVRAGGLELLKRLDDTQDGLSGDSQVRASCAREGTAVCMHGLWFRRMQPTLRWGVALAPE